MASELTFLLKGFLIGFSIAAPVGPIGILCIRRTLANGRLSGLVSGLGAATADGFYAGIAAFGLTFISSLLIDQLFWLRLAGGLFLLYLGVKTFKSNPAEKPLKEQKTGLLKDYASTVFLTLTNPMTILSFAAIFAGFRIAESGGSYALASATVLGVILGSVFWWVILSLSVAFLKQKFKITSLKFVNMISGLILAIFGSLALFSVF